MSIPKQSIARLCHARDASTELSTPHENAIRMLPRFSIASITAAIFVRVSFTRGAVVLTLVIGVGTYVVTRVSEI